MNSPSLIVLLLALCCAAHAQRYDESRVFAHNDYAGPSPFHQAYALQVGYIEADVFLKDGRLMVAHEQEEIRADRTLEQLYLEPLRRGLSQNAGYAYSDVKRQLTLMIDIKTEGVQTLNAIVDALRSYPEITDSPTLQIMISGNVPAPDVWNSYPDFIYFDGRPGKPYSPEQWDRISMISTSFRSHFNWDGEGKLSSAARRKIRDLMAAAHEQGKKFRFWATPDSENAWQQLKAVNADVIVSDRVPELVDFLNSTK